MKGLKVLVVDDEPDVVEILTYNLLKNNCSVQQASNGLEGIKAVQNSIPDLIILDVRMPVMNGIEMCKFIKNHQQYKSIPILFLTADTDDFTAISALEAGGDHFITKPIRPSVIMGMIEELI